MKKLTLKKIELFNLDQEEMNQFKGGDTTIVMSIATPESCAYSCATCGCGGGNGGSNNPYSGTLNNCGTGQGYCATNGCFFESNVHVC